MNEVSRKILAVLMSFVVLFSTTSFAVTKHFCGDTLIDTAIFVQATSCGMESQYTATSSDCLVLKTDCCSDEQFVVDGHNDLQLSFDKISLKNQIFVASFVIAYVNLFESVNKDSTKYFDYSPSPLVRDIYKLDETYLI